MLIYTNFLNSGMAAERADLRRFLSTGLILSGLASIAFGLAKYLGIRSISWFVVVQVKYTEGVKALVCCFAPCTGWAKKLSRKSDPCGCIETRQNHIGPCSIIHSGKRPIFSHHTKCITGHRTSS